MADKYLGQITSDTSADGDHVLFNDVSDTTTHTSGSPKKQTKSDFLAGKANIGANSDITSLSGLTGAVTLTEQSAPSSPASDKVSIYAEDDNGVTRIRSKDSTGAILTLNRDSTFVVRNTTGGTLTKGQAVYVNGANGSRPTIALAKADLVDTMPCIGLLLENISNNTNGRVLVQGLLEGVDTSGFSVGDRLFLSSASAGALTATAPSHPNLKERIGVVLTSHASTGVIEVRVQAIHGEESGTNAETFKIGSTSAGTLTIAKSSTSARTATFPDLTGTVVIDPTTTEGDVIYRNASALTRLPKGTASQILRMNAGATAPEWATVSGGQITYDAIVASSGGDYTTLGAAITAASAGWRIFVKDGTYTESAITSSLANLVIEGESNNLAILSHSSNTLTFSGANVQIRNLGFSGTSGRLVLSGNEFHLHNTRHAYTSSNDNLTFSGSKGAANMVYFTNTSTSNETGNYIFVSGSTNRIDNFYINANPRSQSANKGVLTNSGNFNEYNNIIIEGLGTVRADGQCLVNLGTYATYNNIILRSMTTTTSVAIAIQNLAAGTGASYSNVTVEAGVCTFAGGSKVSNLTSVAGTNSGTVWVYALGNNTQFNNCRLIGNGTSSQVGIDLQGSDNCIVSGNSIVNYPTGVSGTTNADDAVIIGNDFTSCTTPIASAIQERSIIKNNVNVRPVDDSDIIQATNTAGTTINAGEVVIWKAVASGNEVTTTTTGGDSKVYGVALAAITNNAVGRIKVKGKVTSLKVNGTADIAIGDFLSTFTTAGIAKKASAGETAFAIALEAYTTDDSLGVLDALIITPRLI